MDMGVSGRLAVITGGSSGIGFAIANVFIEEGAEVVVNGRNAAKLEAACEKLGPRAHGVVADLTTPDGADALHSFASAFGPVEFLVNNVGRFEPEAFFEISDDRWHEYFEANLMTGIRITRLVLREMLDRDSGSVAFIASEAALRSLPQMAHYSTTKTAQLGLSRSLAELTRGTNVRVNAYLPGPTATDSSLAYFADIARERGTTTEAAIAEFFRTDTPDSLLQDFIDPRLHGRALVQLMTNPAQNGTAQRSDGGAVRTII
jgi:NAD(P)-dependent dehydrogenase (short-subunit alcohol dehydrogenase family)